MATNIPAQVSRFLNYKVVERGISELTQQSYRAALSEFCSFLGPETDLTREVIERYKSSCLQRKLTPRTVTHRLSVLREFCKFLQIEGLLERNPIDRVESPKMWKKLPRYMPEIDIQKLIDAPGPNHNRHFRDALSLRDRAICETFYAAGIRVSELTSARLCDLNIAGGVLTVFGKGSKERIAPLGHLALDALRAYLDNGRPLLQKKQTASPYLFLGMRTPVLTRQAISSLLRLRARRAGISHVHPHMLRHSCATHMQDHGADLRTVQEILGHADISTTEIYTHVSQEHVRDVLLRCHPRNNPKRAQLALFAAPISSLPSSMPCIECSKPAARGKTRCERHLRLSRTASARSKTTAYSQRKLEGQCVNCAEPAAKGKVQCERHLRLNREACKHFHERKHSERRAA